MSKSLFFTIVLSTACIAFSFSQVTAGFKAGVNIADLNSLEFTTGDSSTASSLTDNIEGKRTGYFVGFLVDIPVSENLSFVPEFIFSQQGKDLEEFRIDYLNLPLGLKLDIKKLNVSAGPQVGVKIWTSEQSNVFSNFEASVFGNVGYTFGSNIFIEARYTFGVTDIFQDDNSFRFNQGSNPIFNDLEAKNAVIQIGIGYRI